MLVGPRNPQATIGTPEKLSEKVTRQRYTDGDLYQVRVKSGEAVSPSREQAERHIPSSAVWLGAFEEDDEIYLSMWDRK